MAKQSVTDVKLDNKKVLMRCDFNVPLDEKQRITDDTRIKESLRTINYLLERNCSLILCSHLGKPKGKPVPELSLKPVAERIKTLVPAALKIIMADDCIGPEVKKLAAGLKAKEILLLENLRFHAEEEANNAEFAKELASLAEIFVQEAFGTVHRAHASTVGVTNYLPAVAGFLIQKELDYLGNAINNAKKPFVAVLGGAKVSSKIAVLYNLLEKVDSMIIGGGMIYTFLKAKGISIGNSLVEDDKLSVAKDILEKANSRNIQILLPEDHIIADKVAEDAKSTLTSGIEIPAGQIGVDIGPLTIKKYVDNLINARTIFWNGPMGVFEIAKFEKGTLEIAKAVAAATDKGAISIIGGGDSVAAVNKMGLKERMSHISTGGGAALEFLEGKELPGVAALKDK